MPPFHSFAGDQTDWQVATQFTFFPTTLISLKVIKLNGNPIHTVSDDAFNHTPRLVHLDLGDCGISTLGATVFAGLHNLQKLLLHGNRLQSLVKAQFGLVASTGRMRLLTLYSNPWHCDCRIRWLKEFVEKVRVLTLLL